MIVAASSVFDEELLRLADAARMLEEDICFRRGHLPEDDDVISVNRIIFEWDAVVSQRLNIQVVLVDFDVGGLVDNGERGAGTLPGFQFVRLLRIDHSLDLVLLEAELGQSLVHFLVQLLFLLLLQFLCSLFPLLSLHFEHVPGKASLT